LRKIVRCVFCFSFLLLIIPFVLPAETSAEDPKKVEGTPYDENAITVLRGSPQVSSDRGTTGSGQVLPSVQTYGQLIAAVRGARVASRVRVEKAVEQEKVREAWEIGRLIDAHVLQHKERAAYDQQVIPRLAADLGMSDTELYYMLKFARAYPIFPSTGQLGWGDYRELLALNDPQQRKTVAEEASKNNWNQKELREAVRQAKAKMNGNIGDGKPQETNAVEKLTPLYVGQPGTYKIILAKAGPYQGELALDLGFSNYFRLSEVAQDLTEFKEGDLVSFNEKEIQLLGKPRGTDPDSLLYTYKAWVLRVLDGDTIEAVIDLGFGITTTQTLRLRGIDCPELVSKEGKEAKAFVEDLLKPGTLVFIKTAKSDKYDRYLVDVFITDKNDEGQYLNNLLLEKELAVRVRE
jgi:endonuclease YncB( thermonuclease family)